MAAIFLTLAEAKTSLGVTTTEAVVEAEIQLKLDQAEALVLERCNSTAWWRAITPTWTALTVPPGVQAAILTLLTHLYEHRGDDMAPGAEVWAEVERQIGANKDPVLA